MKEAASRFGFNEVSTPLNFEVHVQYREQNVDITKFNNYVERSIALPDSVDPNKITTGVVVEADGTVRHVPTKVTVDAGKYYATVNSLSNSIYSIVWNPIEFKDVANHWAKSEVNNMGSRMVIQGVGEGLFNPNQDITRAEFTAIVVRGLGLKLETGTASFTDVKSDDWYGSVIQTAYANGLIAGFEDSSFRPNEKITREQAMTIIAKAMEITGLSKKLTTEGVSTSLNSYNDVSQVAAWATKGVTNTLNAGIVTGRSDVQLAPKAHTTRAEVAAMIQRLLKQSDLI
ncbi:Endo-1,4-beta-xylanase A precursor [compost metagenome]